MKNVFSVFKIIKIKKHHFIILSILAFFCGFVNILYINYVKELVNSVINYDINIVGKYILLFVVFAILSFLCKRIYNYIRIDILLKTEKNLKVQYLEKLTDAKLPSLENYSASEILVRFNEEIHQIAAFGVVSLSDYVANFFSLTCIIIYIAINNIYLLFFLVLVPPIIFITKKYGDKSKAEYEKRQKNFALLNSYSKDLFEGYEIIHGLCSEKFFLKKDEKYESALVRNEKQKIIYDRMFWLANIAGYQSVYILFYVIGGILAFNEMFDFGVVVSLFLLLDPLIDMIQSIAGIYTEYYKTNVNIARFCEIMELPDFNGNKQHNIINGNSVSLENVSYSYKNLKNAEHINVLNDISLKFRLSNKIAIIGKNGSGKSTLLKLLTGYDDEYRGSIKVGNQEVSELDTEILKTVFSYLPQETQLFNGTIQDNIVKFIGENISADKVMNNAKQAMIDDLISDASSVCNMRIENGGQNISVGQKQRLGILFALLKEKPMLILDECFSGIDPENAQIILNNICTNCKCGMLLVTHVVYEEIMEKFDYIIVIDKGKILAYDTYERLRTNPIYTRFHKELSEELIDEE